MLRVSGAMITVGNLVQLSSGAEFNEDGNPLSKRQCCITTATRLNPSRARRDALRGITYRDRP